MQANASFACRFSILSQLNGFCRFSLRCAPKRKTNQKSCLSKCGFHSRESQRKLFKAEDKRIVPLMRIGFSVEEATQYLWKSRYYEKVINLNQIEKRIAFFRERCFEDSDIREILKRKRIFNVSLNRMASAERFLHEELCCTAKEVRKIATDHSYILFAKKENLSGCLKVLPALLGMTHEAFKNLVLERPYIICHDHQSVEQLIEVMKEIQIPVTEVYKRIHLRPLSTKYFDAEEGKKCLYVLKTLGCTDNDLQTIVWRVWFYGRLQEERVTNNLEYMRTVLTLSSTELRECIVKEPKGVLVTPTADLMWKIEFLMNEVGLSKQEIIRCSWVLPFRSKRIKARYEFARICGKTAVSIYSLQICNDHHFAKLCGRTKEEYREFYETTEVSSSC